MLPTPPALLPLITRIVRAGFSVRYDGSVNGYVVNTAAANGFGGPGVREIS